jgi:hypothetical protein
MVFKSFCCISVNNATTGVRIDREDGLEYGFSAER